MSFQPLLPSTGLTGWKLLSRTLDRQQSALNQSPEITRDSSYFAQHIAAVDSAEDLVNDRRLLRVALGAFGLQEDIDNRYFIRRILEEGTSSPQALANKLADDRYGHFASAFGFDQPLGPNTGASGFATALVERFNRARFEQAVGQQDDAMRLALYTDRTLPELAQDSGTTEDGRWYKVMGLPALRQVFETALNLPASFSQLDLDQQLVVFRQKSEARFAVSEVADFADPGLRERLIEQYLLQSQMQQGVAYSGMAVALTLLQGAAPPG